MKKGFRWWALLLVAAASLLIAGASPLRRHSPEAPVWQQSEAPVIQLGVRDKFGTLGSYQAVFVVTGPDQKKHQKKISVSGDSWGQVTFPDDFETWSSSGRYTWVCLVKGKVVTHGAFTYKSLKSGGEQLTIPSR